MAASISKTKTKKVVKEQNLMLDTLKYEQLPIACFSPPNI